MAKTDWTLTDTAKPDDFNDIGREINQLRTDVDHIKVPAASLTEAGIVRLSNSTNSTSETMATTPKAVKTVAEATVAAQTRADQAFQLGNERKKQLTDALIAQGIEASTWDDIVEQVGSAKVIPPGKVLKKSEIFGTQFSPDVYYETSIVPTVTGYRYIQTDDINENQTWVINLYGNSLLIGCFDDSTGKINTRTLSLSTAVYPYTSSSNYPTAGPVSEGDSLYLLARPNTSTSYYLARIDLMSGVVTWGPSTIHSNLVTFFVTKNNIYVCETNTSINTTITTINKESLTVVATDIISYNFTSSPSFEMVLEINGEVFFYLSIQTEADQLWVVRLSNKTAYAVFSLGGTYQSPRYIASKDGYIYVCAYHRTPSVTQAKLWKTRPSETGVLTEVWSVLLPASTTTVSISQNYHSATLQFDGEGGILVLVSSPFALYFSSVSNGSGECVAQKANLYRYDMESGVEDVSSRVVLANPLLGNVANIPPYQSPYFLKGRIKGRDNPVLIMNTTYSQLLTLRMFVSF